ncbi:hypothetical protein PAPHI01_1611 [Pancytospora philotis]|nr:hypothetical protein PAPHI01_1611 [Pancytospora philotis]
MLRSVMNVLMLCATAAAGAIKSKRGRAGDGVMELIGSIDEDAALTLIEDKSAIIAMYNVVKRANGIVMGSGNKIINARGFKISHERKVMVREIAARILEAEDPMERITESFEQNNRLAKYVMLEKIIRAVSEGEITAAIHFSKLELPSNDKDVQEKIKVVLRQLDTEIKRQCSLSPAEFVNALTEESLPQDMLVYLLRGRLSDASAVRARFSELVRIGCNGDNSNNVAAEKVTGLINKLEKPECTWIREKYGIRSIVLEALVSQDDSKSVKMLSEIKLLGGTAKGVLEYIKSGNHASASPHLVLQCFKQIPKVGYGKPGSSDIVQLYGYFLETESAYERCRTLKDEPELLHIMPEVMLCNILCYVYEKEKLMACAGESAEVPSMENPADASGLDNPTKVPSVEKPTYGPILPLLIMLAFNGIDEDRAERIQKLSAAVGSGDFFVELLSCTMHAS